MLNFLIQLNQNFTLFIIIPFIFLVGAYLTIRLRFIQILKIHIGISHLVNTKERKKEKGSISNFQALSAVLAGNLGTGNISGMAIALFLGGPGSLVWMWVMSFLGSVLKYAGCFLGFQYRHKNAEGEYVGGPMYYLSFGLKKKFLGVIFAICCIIAALFAGNFIQVNSITLPLENIGIPLPWIAVSLTLLTGAVILGNTQRLVRVVEVIVPAMAILYLAASFVILARYYDKIFDAFGLILSSSFNPVALAGGALGYGFFHALATGFERGILATDAGVGIAPILQSGAKEKNSIMEGLVAIVAPFLVMIICTITFLILIVTNAWEESGMESTNMCVWAFEKGLSSRWGGYTIVVTLFFFAFTTILAWSLAAKKAVEFLLGLKAVKIFEYFFLICIPLGTIAKIYFIWTMADISMALMLIFNLVGIIGLSNQVIKKTLATDL